MQPSLNLPKYHLRQRTENGLSQVWDPVRQRYVLLTPEEWVRQHIIQLLIHHLGYPRTVLRIERGLRVMARDRRTDIVVYQDHQPYIVVECKAPTVPINNAVLEQAGQYNHTLKAPYLMVTNGMVHLAARLVEGNQYRAIQQLPYYAAPQNQSQTIPKQETILGHD